MPDIFSPFFVTIQSVQTVNGCHQIIFFWYVIKFNIFCFRSKMTRHLKGLISDWVWSENKTRRHMIRLIISPFLVTNQSVQAVNCCEASLKLLGIRKYRTSFLNRNLLKLYHVRHDASHRRYVQWSMIFYSWRKALEIATTSIWRTAIEGFCLFQENMPMPVCKWFGTGQQRHVRIFIAMERWVVRKKC